MSLCMIHMITWWFTMCNICNMQIESNPAGVLSKVNFKRLALNVKFIAFFNRFGVVLSPKNGITFGAWMLRNEPWWTWPPQPTQAHPTPTPIIPPAAHLQRRLNLNVLVLQRASHCNMNVKKSAKRAFGFRPPAKATSVCLYWESSCLKYVLVQDGNTLLVILLCYRDVFRRTEWRSRRSPILCHECEVSNAKYLLHCTFAFSFGQIFAILYLLLTSRGLCEWDLSLCSCDQSGSRVAALLTSCASEPTTGGVTHALTEA